MRDDFDVEDTLRRYRTEPSARVKRTVRDRFGEMRDPGPKHRGFWKRPIPLYAAATALAIVVGLSFAAGRTTSRDGYRTGSSTQPAGQDTLMTSVEIEWVPAENDLL